MVTVALGVNAPPGYRQVAVFRHGPAPWLPAPGPYYVDWYVIDDSAALDPLNDAAVSAACLDAHDCAAQRAGGGTAGLYGLRRGVVAARDVRAATWFSKPAGMSYTTLDDAVAEQVGHVPAAFWSRRMTLGPAPELCLLGAEPFPLPETFAAFSVSMELVWPRGVVAEEAREVEVPLH